MASSQSDLPNLPGNGVLVFGMLFNSEIYIVFTLLATSHDCVFYDTLTYILPLHENGLMFSCLMKF